MTLDEFLVLPLHDQFRIRLERQAAREGVTLADVQSRAVESLNAAIAPTWEDDVHTLREAAEILRRRANRLSDGDAKEGLRVSAVRCVLQAALIEAENAKEQSP